MTVSWSERTALACGRELNLPFLLSRFHGMQKIVLMTQ
jgi:hypothetical protein